ncbi:DNA-binding transcriptional MerR regulator [Azospirillum fermentarium]|uniref:MerR family transcriptional regulator n=1 Tax=Azospirillum fermentarium TaxID=1233114 RepID=UPI002225BE61|nr:MerR family transcriptional regulator [Azospirillum fermentarium]MCW2246126.1 DNA-binding transcriptional MerR regulator [Azospirillum fermentarium]
MRSSQVKSATAFRTISEVATDLDVPQHVLRFWETRFPQIRPLKRGGGRRYYRPEDVALLRVIQRLLYKEGYTIRGVQRLLREHRAGLLSLTGGEVDSVDSQEDTVDANALVLDDFSAELPVEAPPDPVFIEPVRSAPPQPAIAPDVREELEALLAELKAMKLLMTSLR